MNNITYEGAFALDDLKRIDLSESEVSKHTVRRGDLLFNRTNSPELVGKTAVWDSDESFAFAGYLVRVRFDEHKACARYVSAFLNSVYGKRMLFAAAKPSINMSNISASGLLRLKVPLPPLAEQKRIAAVLDQAAVIRRKRRQTIQNVTEIAPAVFYQMFPHHGAEPTATLSELGVEFRYGTSNKSGSTGFPTLRIPNVLAAALDLTDLKNVPVEPNEFDRLGLQDGDLLFVRTNGNPDYVGRCAVFDCRIIIAADYDPEQFIYASYLIRGRADPRVVNPRYVRAFLDTPRGRQMVRTQCRTSAGQYNINTHGLGSLTIPVPPIQRQNDFAERLEEIGSLEQRVIKGYAESGKLFDTLVHNALCGEL
jgi:type I restriction enzyme S subunit